MDNIRFLNNKRIFAFTSKDQMLDYIDGKKKILVALNAEKLNRKESPLDDIINRNIGYPDGVGAVLALKRKGLKSIKIAGAEFWLDIIERYSSSKSFYLIGSKEEVIQKTITKLKEDFPDVNIVGYRNGYFKPEDEAKLIQDFKKKKPKVIFVAMGSPKQEYLLAGFLEEYPALYMGLGGSFDVYCGLKNRAPRVYQKFGLEWLYRLLKEPTRWRRQVNLLAFAIKIIFNKI
ncbi:WecB/TagA/CpsF family glycosyltransferase [uncultured Aquimarina sp.]|uniref:WecB/TagA/CpsF family glycosyltransferase n=1 Tax=uncultured Aquimarina sp. TaxID=575652 RepID=UPI002602FC06|nr:WecB/TagA/CpsF family glycosyltransferase [uncultured Aquimarina sp.]